MDRSEPGCRASVRRDLFWEIGIRGRTSAVERGVKPTCVAVDELESAACAGDPAAFGRLIRLHDHDLRGVVWSVVRDAHAVDDVMQVAYEKAFRSIGRFTGGSTIKTWLHTICYRCAIDHGRFEGRRRHLSLAAVEATAGSASTSDAAIGRLEVADALQRLDPDARTLIMLTGVVGMSFDEAAEVTGTPRGTVASRISRARAELRRTVER